MNSRYANFAFAVMVSGIFAIAPVSTVRAQDQENLVVGGVSALQGEAYAVRSDLSEVDLAPGIDVFRADTIQTLINAFLEIQMIDGSRFSLDENTRVVLAEYVTGMEPQGRLSLLRGRMRALISGVFSSRSDSFQVQTNEAVMGVQGTDFLVEAQAGETRVYVYEGLVLVTSRDPAFPEGELLGPGQFLRIRLGEPLVEPSRFQVAVSEPGDLLGSGGDQQMRSGGDQSNDPLQQVPEFPQRLFGPNRDGPFQHPPVPCNPDPTTGSCDP